MDDADNDIILSRTGTDPGSTPQEPLELVAKISDSEKTAFKLVSEGRSGLASGAEYDTTSPESRYGTSIQHCLTFLFITSRLLGESVLCAIRHQF